MLDGGPTTATYVHNAVGGTDVIYVYDLAGKLLAEHDATGAMIRDYVWMNGAPVAQIDAGEVFRYLHVDHLNTPRLATDDSQTVVWRWDSDAFGTTLADEDPDGDLSATTVNLRFPGQYFDQETGFHYNYFRTYDPSTGRYVESDPIGILRDYSLIEPTATIMFSDLSSGIPDGALNHLYSYAKNSPLHTIDPYGLDTLRAKVMSAIGRGDVKQLERLLDAISDPKLRQAAQQAIKKFQTRADDWIAQNCRGSINREFPGSMRDKTLEQIRNGTTSDHKKAWKLLNELRFQKP